ATRDASMRLAFAGPSGAEQELLQKLRAASGPSRETTTARPTRRFNVADWLRWLGPEAWHALGRIGANPRSADSGSSAVSAGDHWDILPPWLERVLREGRSSQVVFELDASLAPGLLQARIGIAWALLDAIAAGTPPNASAAAPVEDDMPGQDALG